MGKKKEMPTPRRKSLFYQKVSIRVDGHHRIVEVKNRPKNKIAERKQDSKMERLYEKGEKCNKKKDWTKRLQTIICLG